MDNEVKVEVPSGRALVVLTYPANDEAAEMKAKRIAATEYVILTERYFDDLTSLVNERLREGWRCQGGGSCQNPAAGVHLVSWHAEKNDYETTKKRIGDLLAEEEAIVDITEALAEVLEDVALPVDQRKRWLSAFEKKLRKIVQPKKGRKRT